MPHITRPQLKGQAFGSGLVICGLIILHARSHGSCACRPECRQSRFRVLAHRSGFAGTLASSGVLSTPNPPSPSPPFMGAGGLLALRGGSAPSRSFHRVGLVAVHEGCAISAPRLCRTAERQHSRFYPGQLQGGPATLHAGVRGLHALCKKNFILL